MLYPFNVLFESNPAGFSVFHLDNEDKQVIKNLNSVFVQGHDWCSYNRNLCHHFR